MLSCSSVVSEESEEDDLHAGEDEECAEDGAGYSADAAVDDDVRDDVGAEQYSEAEEREADASEEREWCVVAVDAQCVDPCAHGVLEGVFEEFALPCAFALDGDFGDAKAGEACADDLFLGVREGVGEVDVARDFGGECSAAGRGVGERVAGEPAEDFAEEDIAEL